MITDEIKAYAKTQLENSPIYKNLTKDIGVLAIMDSLSYKIDLKLREYANVVSEYYSPEQKAILLSHLLYRAGYIRFKKPLVVTAKVKNESAVTIPKDEVFSDGISSYLVKDSVACLAKTETTIEFIQSSIQTFTATAGTNLYLKIDTGIYYNDIYQIECTKDGLEIGHSQQFTDYTKDVSYEVNPNSEITIVFRLNNVQGSNIVVNDTVDVKVYVSKDITEPPEQLSVVASGYDLVVTEIAKTSNFTPALSTEDMRDIIRYNKNIANTLVFNEDYYQLVQASDIRGITGLKCWQQREQELEQAAINSCWCNKVWFCFTTDDETQRTSIETDITNLVYDTTEGKYPLFVAPEIITITIDLTITNNISKRIPVEVQGKIKSDLEGIYDDKYKKISKTIAYRSAFENLRNYNTDIDLVMTDKGTFRNSKFYDVDVNLTIVERGY